MVTWYKFTFAICRKGDPKSVYYHPASGSSRPEDFLQLAYISTSVREWRTYRRLGYHHGNNYAFLSFEIQEDLVYSSSVSRLFCLFVVVWFVYLFFKGNILVEKSFQILVCMMEQFSSNFMRTLNLRRVLIV